jgi:hypothetical protein
MRGDHTRVEDPEPVHPSRRQAAMARPSLTDSARALAAIAVVSSLVAACAAAPTATTTAQPSPMAFIAERDGVRVVLALDHARLTPGQPLRAKVQVTNYEPGSVFWQGGGCDLLEALSVVGPPAPELDPGRAWPGEAGVLKSVTVSTEMLGFLPPQALERPEVAFGCPADLRVNELQSGETTEAVAVWPATSELGVPVPGGRYTIKASFPFLARLATGEFKGDPLDDRNPIVVQTAIDVDPPSQTASPYVATDAILADPRFAAWLATVPRQRWTSSQLRYGGGMWTLTLNLDAPAERGIVMVDATTGAVSELRVLPGS